MFSLSKYKFTKLYTVTIHQDPVLDNQSEELNSCLNYTYFSIQASMLSDLEVKNTGNMNLPQQFMSFGSWISDFRLMQRYCWGEADEAAVCTGGITPTSSLTQTWLQHPILNFIISQITQPFIVKVSPHTTVFLNSVSLSAWKVTAALLLEIKLFMMMKNDEIQKKTSKKKKIQIH